MYCSRNLDRKHLQRPCHLKEEGANLQTNLTQELGKAILWTWRLRETGYSPWIESFV